MQQSGKDIASNSPKSLKKSSKSSDKSPYLPKDADQYIK